MIDFSSPLFWPIAILGVYNLFVLIMYGADKLFATGNSWRVSEKILLLLALFGGSVGALLGMYLFRLKTKKLSFQFWIVLILIIQIGIGLLLYNYL